MSAFAPNPEKICRWNARAAGVGAMLFWSGCASEFLLVGDVRPPATVLSPTPDVVAPRDAWRIAEAYVREHPGNEVVIGSGDSMLPLYRDGTVLVLQPSPVSTLRPSMTAVFFGDRGRPVAHVLIEKTARGWRAMGLGNKECDLTLVRDDNLIGVVVRAYTPTTGSADLASGAEHSVSVGAVFQTTADTTGLAPVRAHGPVAGTQ